MNEVLQNMIENNINNLNSFSNSNIGELYNLVDNYVKKLNICSFGERGVYYIKQDNNGFEIGFDYGPDIYYYINRVEIENDDCFIDMKYINANIISFKQAIIRNEIIEINRRIDSLEQKGITRKMIKKYINL